MSQTIQIKRKTNGAGVPSSLAPGELAYNTTGNTLHIGDASNVVQALVSSARQVELTGAQTIAGAKTIAVGNLKVTGGNLNEVLRTDGAGNLSFVPAAVSQMFVGTFNATTGAITWTAGTGSGSTLPVPGAGNNGWYLICTVAGSTPPGGSPAGTYNTNDWLISNGTAWTHVALGSAASSIVASQVGVAPTILGGDDVQEVLGLLNTEVTNIKTVNTSQDTAIAGKATTAYVDAAVANKVVGPGSAVNDDIAVFDGVTGKLIKSGGSSLTTLNASIASKASVVYVDNAVANRVSKLGDVMTGDLVIQKVTPELRLNKVSGANVIRAQKGGLDRWIIFYGDNATESGGDLGSDIVLENYNDAGTKIGVPMTISRKTGAMHVLNPVAAENSTRVATTAFVQAYLGYNNIWTGANNWGATANNRTTISNGSVTLRQDSGGIATWFDAYNYSVTGVNQGGYMMRGNLNGYGGVDIVALSTGDFSSGPNRSVKARINTLIAGVTTMQVDIGDGVVVGAPTGGFKGNGTVNATGFFINGSSVTALFNALTARIDELEARLAALEA